MKKLFELKEHESLQGVGPSKSFDGMKLVEWKKPMDNCPSGYYASYIIGAEWTKDMECSVVVTPKKGMENIDFVSMFYYCFSTGLDAKRFAEIYTINADQPPIEIKGVNFPIGILTVMHFLSVVSHIRCLKKGYKSRTVNLKKIRGHVDILKNDRINISQHRYHSIYCEYNEYDVNIPENRIIKKALLFAKKYLKQSYLTGKGGALVNTLYAKCKTKFADVSSEVNIDQIKETRYHKLFKEYGEALRLAKMILKQYDYNIRNVAVDDTKVIPFTIDMSLLYEHYVYGLLYEAYHETIVYQYIGYKDTQPDFLFCSKDFKAILDTKYIPKYDNEPLETYVIRQLSGYSRDICILKRLGYVDITEESPTPSTPCVIIYPTESDKGDNPFLETSLQRLCTNRVPELSQFYKIAVPIPIIKTNNN